MSNRGKLTIKIAGYYSLVSAFALVVVCLLLIFNISEVSDFYEIVLKEFVAGLAPGDVKFYKISSIINLSLSALINLFSGRTYLRIAKNPHPIARDYYSLMSTALIQLFFGGTVIGGVIALVVACRNTHLKKINPANANTVSNLDILKSQVEQLNIQRERNKITAEEYQIELDKLLENYAKTQK